VTLTFRSACVIAFATAAILPACSTSKSTPTAPTACTYAVSSTNVSAEAAGGPMSVSVTTGSTCVWTSLTNASFLTMTSPAGVPGSGTATFTVGQNTGPARSGPFTLGGQTIAVNQAAGGGGNVPPPSTDAIYGNWAGAITMNVGCVGGLPQTFQWTGVIRQGGFTGTEFVISIPIVGVVGQVYPVTLNGSGLLFSVQVDSTYVFTGTIAADRRSFSGTFAGSNCRATGTPVLPSGTWNGTHQ
jgi:hypothetical protein